MGDKRDLNFQSTQRQNRILPEDSFGDWKWREALAELMVPLIGSLYRNGVNIIVSSILLDANEIPFEKIKNMMPWATKIEICPAVCTKCDQDAYFTEAMFDINNATQEEKIGSFGMYEPRCFKHYSSFKNK